MQEQLAAQHFRKVSEASQGFWRTVPDLINISEFKALSLRRLVVGRSLDL